MDAPQLHLLLNHVPLFFPLIATLLLASAFIFRSKDLRIASYWLFVVAALFVIPVYKSGERAEHTIKNYPGSSRALIHDHERSAKPAALLLELIGVTSLLLLFVRKLRGSTLISSSLLVAAILLIALMARTAHLGDSFATKRSAPKIQI